MSTSSGSLCVVISLCPHAQARLRSAGLDIPGGAIDKRELVEALLVGRGSSDAACSICCEDYAVGDVLRRLRCNHSFHLVRPRVALRSFALNVRRWHAFACQARHFDALYAAHPILLRSLSWDT